MNENLQENNNDKQKYTLRILSIGTISLGEKVVVSDPCFNLNSWHLGVIGDVAPGKYRAFVSHIHDGKNQARRLIIVKEDVKRVSFVRRPIFSMGYTESGVVGFHNYNYFKLHQINGSYGNTWCNNMEYLYSLPDCCCTIDGRCAISESGIGAGGYECYAAYNDGQIVALRIVFLDEVEKNNDGKEEMSMEDACFLRLRDVYEDAKVSSLSDYLDEEAEYRLILKIAINGL